MERHVELRKLISLARRSSIINIFEDAFKKALLSFPLLFPFFVLVATTKGENPHAENNDCALRGNEQANGKKR